jgi:hypothetical protein
VKFISSKSISLIVLLFGLLACRPVFAIGWTEIIIIVILVIVLMGPLLFRMYRFIDRIQRAREDEEKKK